MIQIRTLGLDGVDRALGIMADAVGPAEMRRFQEGVIRPMPLTGSSEPIVRKGFTLEEQAVTAFANEGKTKLLGGWEAYASEPRYAEYKAERDAGGKVGTWQGSSNPLSSTFLRGSADHIEDITADGFRWGSARYYAGLFHDGQYQPWDDVQAPAREIVVVNEQFAREVARGLQRLVVYEVRAKGGNISTVRVNL
jgi:hypothetical protein